MGTCCPPKTAPCPSGIVTPRNILLFGPSSLTIQNSISISFSRFCMGPKCHDNALSMGKKSQNCPSTWDFVTLQEEDRVTAIGNTHKILGKDRTCGQTDRQTDTHTEQTYSSQYFATVPGGVVISIKACYIFVYSNQVKYSRPIVRSLREW